MADTIFSKIIRGEISADKVYEDEDYLAFKDINPQAPVHVLVIPKKEIPRYSEIKKEDSDLIGGLFLTVKKVADKLDLGDYRLVVNNGEKAGQEVEHLHVHILAGRDMQWPPG